MGGNAGRCASVGLSVSLAVAKFLNRTRSFSGLEAIRDWRLYSLLARRARMLLFLSASLNFLTVNEKKSSKHANAGIPTESKHYCFNHLVELNVKWN